MNKINKKSVSKIVSKTVDTTVKLAGKSARLASKGSKFVLTNTSPKVKTAVTIGSVVFVATMFVVPFAAATLGIAAATYSFCFTDTKSSKKDV